MFSSYCHQRLCEKDIRVGFEGGKDRFYVDILQEKLPDEEHWFMRLRVWVVGK